MRRRVSENEEVSYWLSYSDMMAALLLVFVLIITFTCLQSKIEYEEKVAQLEEITEQISEQQKTIDNLIGIKGEIVSALINEFNQSGLAISIDQTSGAITFDSDLLFDPDSDILKQSSKDFLDAFLPKYFSIILSDEFSDNIAEIIFEGHTAKYGTYMNSLRLSQSRAFAVASYAINDNSVLKDSFDLNKLRAVLTCNGKAYSHPIYNEDGTINDRDSRRVEIKFRLKNEEIVDEIQKALNQAEY